jgi:phosphatidylserine/phosphatidylglycerophosphate/cardiolipin synthase-like enzyme
MSARRAPAPVPFTALSALLLLAAVFLFFQAQGRADNPPSPQVGSATPGGARPGVFFTRPDAQSIPALASGVEYGIAATLDSATHSVEVAVYHINLERIRDSLVRAQRRGVIVRVVTESDNILEPVVAALEAAGIPVLGDRREGLMHHKFLVIDNRIVWTGSMNLTPNDVGQNDNNFIRLESAELAADYLAEFDEMWADRFGPDSLADTPHPRLTVNGIPVEAYFSPDDGVSARIVGLIQGARRTVRFLAFSFTSDEIALAMIERAQAGVDVQGVMDSGQSQGLGTELDRLRQAGIVVRRDGNPGLMHHKVILVDGGAVLTGSYNFSRSAEESNDENGLILFDPDVASLFDQEWERVFALGGP